MPRSLDPNARLVFVLADDKDKSPQPRLFGKPLTIAQSRNMAVAVQAIRHAKDIVEQVDGIVDLVMSVLSGWENIIDPETNQPLAFNRQTLTDVLTIDELNEIVELVASGGRLTADDRKKSESQP